MFNICKTENVEIVSFTQQVFIAWLIVRSTSVGAITSTPPYSPLNMHTYINSAKHTFILTRLLKKPQKNPTHPFRSIPCSSAVVL